MRKNVFLMLLVLAVLPVSAQKFEEFFNDSTIRVDYIFAGDSVNQHLYLDGLNQMAGWAGRRQHLSELPLEGNGQLFVRDVASGKVIYCTSFSALFLEWQSTAEASHVSRSFENCFLIPKPKRPVDVTLTLRNTHGKVSASLTHRIDPADVLIRHIGERNNPSYTYIYKGGDPKDCIDIAFLSEGYTADEMPVFLNDCMRAREALFASEPFKQYKNRFNLVAVCAPSADSGVSDPIANQWKSTAVGAHFDTFYSPRYMTSPNMKRIHDLLAGVPYEQIIVLANSSTYSAGGIYNSIEFSCTHHSRYLPVVVHEFGHSFGGLADEYFYDDQYTTMYPSDTEPWEQNLTTLVNFDSKWKDMLPKGTAIPTPTIPLIQKDTSSTLPRSNKKANPMDDPIFTKVGVYEGGGYQSKGVYRPCQECRMKINEAPDFCPVCQRAIARIIKFYTTE